MDRRSGAGEVPNAVHLELDWLSHIVTDEFKSRVTNPLLNIDFAARKVVVEANHFLARLHQAVNEVGANETGTACYKISCSHLKSLSELV
jgi:hypothetical protein